jgi:hypothetical protein
MDRIQAAELQGHALDAREAVHRISEVIAGLSEADRSRFAPHIGAVYEALEFGLLRDVYDRYPDLRPADGEEPHISSTLHWRSVSLPASVSAQDVDVLIFSVDAKLAEDRDGCRKSAPQTGRHHVVCKL